MITESSKTYSGACIGLKHTLNRGPLKFPEGIAKLTCLFPRKCKTKTKKQQQHQKTPICHYPLN